MDAKTYDTLRADLAKAGLVLPAPIQGGAFVPLAAMLIPLIPMLVTSVTSIVEAIRQDPGVPEDQSAAITAVADALDVTNARVQALVIRTV